MQSETQNIPISVDWKYLGKNINAMILHFMCIFWYKCVRTHFYCVVNNRISRYTLQVMQSEFMPCTLQRRSLQISKKKKNAAASRLIAVKVLFPSLMWHPFTSYFLHLKVYLPRKCFQWVNTNSLKSEIKKKKNLVQSSGHALTTMHLNQKKRRKKMHSINFY